MKRKILQHPWEKKKGVPRSKEEWDASCLFVGNDEGQSRRPLEGIIHTCFTTQGFAQVPGKVIEILYLPNHGLQTCFT